MTESRAAARLRRHLKIVRDEFDESARAAAKADSFVAQFVSSTPAEVTAYIDDNVTDLASAKLVLKKMALMLLLIARREYKE